MSIECADTALPLCPPEAVREWFRTYREMPDWPVHYNGPHAADPGAGCWDAWLRRDAEAAAALMKPANEDVLVSRPVSTAVGNVKNNGRSYWTVT